MPTVGFGRMNADATLEEVIDRVAKMQKTLDYLMQGGLDTKNVREISGWLVSPDRLVSKDGDVGMSTEDTGADDVRFFAGDKFSVTKSGIATLVEMILKSVASGQRVVIDSTGFHTYDSSGVERITIGNTPTKGVKALHFYGPGGPDPLNQGLLVYDTETVDGASRTGQYLVGPDAQVLLFDDAGGVRLLVNPSSAEGFRALPSSRPQINSGGGWGDIALKSEADNRGRSLAYNSSTKELRLQDANGNLLSSVFLT
jgi:hypothetical protein